MVIVLLLIVIFMVGRLFIICMCICWWVVN